MSDILSERVARLEEKTQSIMNALERIENGQERAAAASEKIASELHQFMRFADDRYARKEELADLSTRVAKALSSQEKDVKSLSLKIASWSGAFGIVGFLVAELVAKLPIFGK